MSGVRRGNDGRQSGGGDKAGRYVSSGVNGTFGIARLMSARVENVLSTSATYCGVGCSAPPVLK